MQKDLQLTTLFECLFKFSFHFGFRFVLCRHKPYNMSPRTGAYKKKLKSKMQLFKFNFLKYSAAIKENSEEMKTKKVTKRRKTRETGKNNSL